MDKLNADGNLIGRLGALIVIAAAIIVLGRVCGMGEMHLLGQMKGCCLFETSAKPAK